MTIVSYNGLIDTKGEFQSVVSFASITFTKNKIYTIQTTGMVYLKIADAVILVNNIKPYQYKAGDETLYIKTNYTPSSLTILEGE